MKATIDSLKRGGVVLGAFLCATMGMPTFGAVDITDFIRSCGTGNYHVRCGNGTKSYASVDTAFDGITSGGDSSPDTRVLLCTTNSGGATIPTPVSLLYYIDEGVLSHYDFKVTAFTLYRLMSGYYYMQRSPTEFELQGYDGSQWHLLFRTDETQTWDAETLSRTYESLPKIKPATAHTGSCSPKIMAIPAGRASMNSFFSGKLRATRSSGTARKVPNGMRPMRTGLTVRAMSRTGCPARRPYSTNVVLRQSPSKERTMLEESSFRKRTSSRSRAERWP